MTLWRQTGTVELALVEASGWREWPPRLPGQPIFYPVLNEEYAAKIARDWNVPHSGAGYVTRFQVLRSFLDQYEVRQAGGKRAICCGDGSQCSARASWPTRPRGHGPALDGIVGRRSAPAGSAARSAARARPLDGVVPGRRAARPPRSACPASTSRSHAPGRTSVPGPGRLCRLPGTLARCRDWRDRHLRFRFDDRLQPLPDIGDLLREADRDPIAVVGREHVQAEASAQRRYLTVPLPIGACPGTLFPGL